MEERFYILSVSFQVAGALILLIKSLKGKVLDKAKEMYVSEFKGPLISEKNKIVLSKERIQEIAMDIYINRIAFLYLSIGYIISIFGKQNTNISKGSICMYMVIASLLLIAGGYIFSKTISKMHFKEDIEEDIKNFKYQKNTVMLNITDKN
ncbi:hypothetical protein [Clostridium cadaveris]|uniref:hypothetical protein n=1 Tax=Clostridium cadaveris TaxID=1529 RepID=UPI000C074F88|nr:hypothetical protein [Clostridium cadaveris]